MTGGNNKMGKGLGAESGRRGLGMGGGGGGLEGSINQPWRPGEGRPGRVGKGKGDEAGRGGESLRDHRPGSVSPINSVIVSVIKVIIIIVVVGDR